MEKEIWFDMDGTIADLYAVDDWLKKLRGYDPSPYEDAVPLVNMNVLARYLNRLHAKGYSINIVSWLSKCSTTEYDEAVTKAKIKWLKKHLRSVEFTRIDILPYGVPKQIGRDGILFDDEELNRRNWSGAAFDESEILFVLKYLD